MANEAPITLARVWLQVDRRGPQDCWEFIGGRCNGYGWIARQYAHRIVLTHTQGPEPFAGADARHLCGNKPCCNPAHLAWGTRAENEADKIAHGRSNRGERQGHAKLSSGDVLGIRSRCADGERQAEVARAFGLDPSTVSQIVNRKRWAWL